MIVLRTPKRQRAHARVGHVPGLDALVFTGGVGEHSAEVRSQTAAGLAFLGVSLDSSRNEDTNGDGEIGADLAAVRTLALTAREDLEIARQVRTLLSR
ncbi:MAG TPA: hypothetical protein VIJ66_04820 [Solirubrobacteraceae bacterium]